MRCSKKFKIKNPDVKEKLFHWAQQFDEIVWLDSNNYKHSYSSYDAVLAVEAFTAIRTDYHSGFDKLQEYQQQTDDWIFGYLTYDLKNDVEKLESKNFDGLLFSDLYFFQPKKLFLLKGNELEMQYLRMVDDEMESDFSEIQNFQIEKIPASEAKIKVASRINKEAYLEKVKQMLWHIQRGDIYEANLCQEFYAEDATINPVQVFEALNKISQPPFATFLKLENKYALCASPERYIKKEANKIISQPIKGTSARGKSAEEDQQRSEELANNPKERSENIMIVDLVRNDLSRTAAKGSVEVEELCGVHSFKQVHQLISTVVSKVENSIPPVEILRTTFPMGSMTGAPKVSAMQIIEKLEETKRGLYSGAIGYFRPSQDTLADFDFNVVIRSILYNAENKHLSFSVGGAITSKSDAEQEYNECMVKAAAMRKVLEDSCM